MSGNSLLRSRIIWHLRHVWTKEYGNRSRWMGFERLAKELREEIPNVKREVHLMAKEGRLFRGVASSPDGASHGTGYFLSASWEEHKPGRVEDPTPDEFTL